MGVKIWDGLGKTLEGVLLQKDFYLFGYIQLICVPFSMLLLPSGSTDAEESRIRVT